MNALLCTNIAMGSLDSFSPSCPNGGILVLERIKERSKDYDFLFIINDSHQENDPEFKYLPRHMIKGESSTLQLTDYQSSLKSSHIQYLQKNTFSALGNDHNKKLILEYKFDEISISGFNLCFDGIATIMDVLDAKQKVKVEVDMMGCLTEDSYNLGEKYLKWIGVI